MTSRLLEELFPALPPDERHQIVPRGDNAKYLTSHNGKSVTEHVSSRWAAICTLDLQGLDKKQIADRMGLHYNTVTQITNSPKYIAYRESRLDVLDKDFFAMKPLAVAALRNGLTSADENTALRASEQWFKGASFGGFSRNVEPPSQLTAEDVAAALVNAVQVNVNVNVGAKEGE